MEGGEGAGTGTDFMGAPVAALATLFGVAAWVGAPALAGVRSAAKSACAVASADGGAGTAGAALDELASAALLPFLPTAKPRPVPNTKASAAATSAAARLGSFFELRSRLRVAGTSPCMSVASFWPTRPGRSPSW